MAVAKPRFLLLLAFACFVLTYAAFINHYVWAGAGGADSSGYMNIAKLLVGGELTAPLRAIEGLPPNTLPDFTYVPLGFIKLDQQTLAPSYPFGLPLLTAALGAFAGVDAAAPVVIALHSIGAVVLTAVLGRLLGLRLGLAILAGLLLALCPLYVLYSLQMMSDMPATAWTLATFTTAVLGRANDRWLVISGLCFSMSVLVRNTNAIVIVALIPLIGMNFRGWLYLGLGAAPAGLFNLALNAHLYGNPLRTGYGSVNGLFRWRHIPLSLANYATYMPALLSPLVALALLAPVFLRRVSRPTAALIALWPLAFFVFYAPYYYTHETWWYHRFVLPAFPALIIGSLLVVQHIADRPAVRAFIDSRKAASALLALATLALVIANAAYWNRHFATHLVGRGEMRYLQSLEIVRPPIPDNAVVLTMQSSGAFFYYRPWIVVRYDQIRGDEMQRILQAAARASRPIFAIVHQFERTSHPQHMPMFDAWKTIGSFEDRTFYAFDPASFASR